MIECHRKEEREKTNCNPKSSKDNPLRNASDPYLSSLPQTTEASSNIRSPRIASSVLPGTVAALYARQGPRRPPLSLSVPPGRRQPLLLLRETGVHHSPLAPKDSTPSSPAEDPAPGGLSVGLDREEDR